MRSMYRALLALSFAASLAVTPACGSKVVDELDSLTEKMCACTDKECANAMRSEVQAWSERNAAAQGRRKDRDKIHKLLERSNNCMKNIFLGRNADAEPAADGKQPPKDK